MSEEALLPKNQDTVDLAEAVVSGFGGRLAIGSYRDVTLAFREYLSEKASGTSGAIDKFKAAINRTPNPARACKIATIAVIALPMINSFEPIPDYAEVLAELEALQAAACGTPVPPTPTPVPVPVP